MAAMMLTMHTAIVKKNLALTLLQPFLGRHL